MTQETEDTMMGKKSILAVWCVMSCLLLTACGGGQDEAPNAENVQAQEEPDSGDEADAGTEPNSGADAKTDAGAAADNGTLSEEPQYGAQISDQCFDVNLRPLGDVRFVSYEPDADKIPCLDAGFVIEKNKGRHDTDMMLPGWTDDNVRENLKFDSVQAVSFADLEGDGNDDIIVICDYRKLEENAETGNYTEARIYNGSADGSFTLNRDLSNAANSALVEKTVKSVKDFLGVGRKVGGKDTSASAKPWQEMYIDYLQDSSDDDVESFTLIYLDDNDVPELVQVGAYEGAGCVIVSVADGKLQKTQLDRLNFTYLEREGLLCNSDGNMDYYYDIVWRMKEGRMEKIASGWWGAKDNSNVRFDADGSPIYIYVWEGQEMSEMEYAAALKKVYDYARAKSCVNYSDDELDSRMEMISRLENM